MTKRRKKIKTKPLPPKSNISQYRTENSEQIIHAESESTIHHVFQVMLNLPAWAWICGICVLAVTILLVTGVNNRSLLYELLPTPTAFAPAEKNESLIIVTDFEDRSDGQYKGMDPGQYIYERLLSQSQADALDVRVERLRQIVDDNTVKSTGESYNATLVLWGWYDAYTITPRITLIKPKFLGGITPDIERLKLLNEQHKIEVTLTTDLPDQATFLILFTLGLNAGYEKSFTYFDSALRAIPAGSLIDPSELYRMRGLLYLLSFEHQKAIADFSRVLERHPDDGMALGNRAEAYRWTGEYDKAIAYYTQVIEREESSLIYFMRAGAYGDAGEYEKALVDYNRSIDLFQDTENQLTSLLFSLYLGRGNTYSDLSQFDKSIADYTHALEISPDSAIVYADRGSAYQELGSYDLALADYSTAILLGIPNNQDLARVYDYRGRTYAKRSEYNSAIIDYTKAIQIWPEDYQAYSNRGVAYHLLDNYDSALADYNRALELHPSDYMTYYRRATAYLELKDYDQAIKDCYKVIELAPSYADAYYLRGLIYQEMGKTAEADADFKKYEDLTGQKP